MPISVDIKKLFEAGAHFGHKTSRWNSSMRDYIHSDRDGIHIINLEKTATLLEEALQAITKTVAGGKQVLIVGTKRQTKPVVQHIAKETGQPYVCERWLGGLLTNSQTMNERVKHLVSLEEQLASGQLESRYSKLEVQRFEEEVAKLNTNLGGVKEMQGNPGLVIALDAVTNDLALREANRLKIPTVALLDSNADAKLATLPVPCNDDSIAVLNLIAEYIIDAIKEGKSKSAKKSADAEAKVETDTPEA